MEDKACEVYGFLKTQRGWYPSEVLLSHSGTFSKYAKYSSYLHNAGAIESAVEGIPKVEIDLLLRNEIKLGIRFYGTVPLQFFNSLIYSTRSLEDRLMTERSSGMQNQLSGIRVHRPTRAMESDIILRSI